MEPYIGTILAFGFNFPPYGWAFCNGALMQIRQNTALYTLFGTSFGGDGVTTFGLPNLQGRTAVGVSNGANPGGTGGATSYTMTMDQMPAHTHSATSTIAVPVLADDSNQTSPSGNSLAISAGVNVYATQAPDSSLAPFNATGTLSPAGGGIPVTTTSPYLTLNYSVALTGIFPSRN